MKSITPADYHRQYSKVIEFLIEKQIKDRNPDIEQDVFLAELNQQYNKLIKDFFDIENLDG